MSAIVAIWAVGMLAFILLPLILDSDSRKRWWKRIINCKWDVLVEEQATTSNNSEPFRYVMSREQEDDIRKGYLVERLDKYSKTLTDSDIKSVFNRERKDMDVTLESSVGLGSSSESLDAEVVVSDVESGDSESTTDSETDAECSSDDVTTVEDVAMDEFMGDSITNITIPLAGAQCQAEAKMDDETREVPNGCAVCLSAFDPEDRVTWSSNPSCSHVFHQSCVLDWFQAYGQKTLKRHRREEERTGVVNFSNDPVANITNFPMLCPCCRQEFISPPREVTIDEKIEESSLNGSEASTAQSSNPDVVAQDNATAVVVGDENV